MSICTEATYSCEDQDIVTRTYDDVNKIYAVKHEVEGESIYFETTSDRHTAVSLFVCRIAQFEACFANNDHSEVPAVQFIDCLKDAYSTM